jgi:hypothetical protein
MSLVSVLFLVIGVPGIYIAEKNHDAQFLHNLDDYYGWISFLVAAIFSFLILLKKNPGKSS